VAFRRCRSNPKCGAPAAGGCGTGAVGRGIGYPSQRLDLIILSGYEN